MQQQSRRQEAATTPRPRADASGTPRPRPLTPIINLSPTAGTQPSLHNSSTSMGGRARWIRLLPSSTPQGAGGNMKGPISGNLAKPAPDWTAVQRQMDREWDTWVDSLGPEWLRLNLSGHPSPQLTRLGFFDGDCLHLARCHDELVGQRVLDYLRGEWPTLDNGRKVVMALPMHVVLRDMLPAIVQGVTGRAPVVIYAHERSGTQIWNRKLDLHALRGVGRGARGNLRVI